jgi:hypothetical protein
MKNIKIIIFFLIVLSICLVFTACSSNNDNNKDINIDKNEKSPDDKSEAVETPTELRDSLPDGLDFKGERVNIYVRESSGDNYMEFYVESENGDIVNDVIYRRNKTVEERLNLNINVIPGPGWNGYTKALSNIRNSISAGDQTYDVIAGYTAYIPALSAEGLFMNLHELPYIELSKPWWNKSIIDELTITGKLDFIAGDINFTMLGNCLIVYENAKIRQELGLPNIYDAVFEGKWTLDYMHQLTKGIYRDVNGDGKRDKNDFYGASWAILNLSDAFLGSSDIKMTKKDENGLPYFNTDYEKLATLVDKVYNFYYQSEGTFATDEGSTIEKFRNDQTYLASGYLCYAYDHFRDMESEYCIIPYPKYDENQEKYMTNVQDGMSILCIPVNSSRTEMSGAFLEAMASESYKTVSPEYFNVAMKVKYARDETSAKMLDIIREGINLNFAYVYNYSIGSPWAVMRDLMLKKSGDFASWYDKNEPKIQIAITKLIDKMEESK